MFRPRWDSEHIRLVRRGGGPQRICAFRLPFDSLFLHLLLSLADVGELPREVPCNVGSMGRDEVRIRCRRRREESSGKEFSKRIDVLQTSIQSSCRFSRLGVGQRWEPHRVRFSSSSMSLTRCAHLLSTIRAWSSIWSLSSFVRYLTPAKASAFPERISVRSKFLAWRIYVGCASTLRYGRRAPLRRELRVLMCFNYTKSEYNEHS